MARFTHDGQELAYREFGDPQSARVTILLHGLLLSQKMQWPLAERLGARGNRVITLDLLGHGVSDRPVDMWRYSMTFFGEQVLALLDHLGLDEAVVLGTSLGANVALEISAAAPQRLRGMVVEMPVLDNALLACAVAFTPMLLATTFGAPITRRSSRLASLIPRRPLPLWGEIALDFISQSPDPAAAVLQGLFFGRTAPHRAERRTLRTPALIIGHRRDPVHPFSDAGMLADELVAGRLIEADSLIELRLRPNRLEGEIAAFIDECWRPRRAQRTRRAASSR